MPALRGRVQELGFSEQQLETALQHIRESAPIIMHVNLNTCLEYLEKDTHYRSQFETGTSGGSTNLARRKSWERGMFGESYDSLDDSSDVWRPKYGVLNQLSDPLGVLGCMQYGNSYFVMKGSTASLRISASLLVS